VLLAGKSVVVTGADGFIGRHLEGSNYRESGADSADVKIIPRGRPTTQRLQVQTVYLRAIEAYRCRVRLAWVLRSFRQRFDPACALLVRLSARHRNTCLLLLERQPWSILPKIPDMLGGEASRHC
jgi:hypothetical protein